MIFVPICQIFCAFSNAMKYSTELTQGVQNQFPLSWPVGNYTVVESTRELDREFGGACRKSLPASLACRNILVRLGHFDAICPSIAAILGFLAML